MDDISPLDDLEAFLSEFQIDRAMMAAQVLDESDQAPFPPGPWPVEVRSSPLHGLGLFTTRDVAFGELIAPGRFQGMRTPAGRYTNHHPTPNAEAMASDSDILLVAVRSIPAGHEVFMNYRQALTVNLETADQLRSQPTSRRRIRG